MSLTHPPPVTSLFFTIICFTTLNTLPLPSSFSKFSPIFLPSASFALPITFFALHFAILYSAVATLSLFVPFAFSFAMYNRRFSFTALSQSLFHHHETLCLDDPLLLVLPHTSSAPSSKHPFNSLHISSALVTILIATSYFS